MKPTAITHTLTAVLLLLWCSCSREAEPYPDEAAGEGRVELILRMSVNGGGTRINGSSTRADAVDFENPADIREGIESLRIVIVRPDADNIVEQNDLIRFPEDDRIWNDSKVYHYEVIGGEKKRVYLIGNENSLGADNIARIASIRQDHPLPSDIDNLLLSSPEGHPYIVNTDESGRYIPMSEIFDIRVKEAEAGAEVKDEANLFITRAASKFSFTVTSEPESVFGDRGLRITELSISGMADREWFFPHNTIYNPGKFEISNNPLNGRLITSFTTPAATITKPYTFNPVDFGIKGLTDNTTLSATYTPLEYFLESPDETFYLSGTAVSNGLERPFGPVALPNLPRMPRNTHTVINLTFKGETLDVEVTVFPYTAVNLNPSFGFIIPATGIELETRELTLHVGDTISLGVTVEPDDVTDRTLEWSSSNTQVASVDSDGLITALTTGTTDITVKCGDITGICRINVIP